MLLPLKGIGQFHTFVLFVPEKQHKSRKTKSQFTAGQADGQTETSGQSVSQTG